MSRRLWTIEDDYVLWCLHARGRDAKWIARFMCCHTTTIHRRARALGIAFNVRHAWTPAEDAELRRRYPDAQAAVVARDLGMTITSVYNRATKLGLHKSDAFKESDRSGRILRGRTDPRMIATQFKKGLVPANKGLRRPGWGPGRMRQTQFKKGQMSGAARHNYVPVGSTRIVYGNLERKITDDPSLYPAARWAPVHRLVWEAAHGKVPRGRLVVFKPGMHTTVADEITLDRLERITRAENMRRNTYHRYPQPIPKLIQLRGALNRKINNRTSKHEKQDRGSAQSPVRRARSAGGQG